MKQLRITIIAMLLALLPLAAGAQCQFRNTAFKAGEHLSYNLYFNWKFVWVKAGTASMKITQGKYHGQPAYRAALTTKSSKRVDNYFILRDTLLCYSTLDLAPLYYRKGAEEGKHYTVDEVWYKYPNEQISITQSRLKRNGEKKVRTFSPDECVYDMMNIFLRARSFDPANWKSGYTVKFPIADGDGTAPAQLRFIGRKTIKADNGTKYKCLELSYVEYNKKEWKEIARFFVTDDDNHVPIRLDMFLKFGSAKAFLTNMSGVKSAVTSVAK